MSTGVIERLEEAISAMTDIDLDTLAAAELDSLVIRFAAGQAPPRRRRGRAFGPLGRDVDVAGGRLPLGSGPAVAGRGDVDAHRPR